MNKKLVKTFILFSANKKYIEKEGNQWCVRCCLASAKSDFDELPENEKFNMPIGDVLKQYATGFEETYYDKPLVEARDYLASKNFELLFDTRKRAISFMIKEANKLK